VVDGRCSDARRGKSDADVGKRAPGGSPRASAASGRVLLDEIDEILGFLETDAEGASNCSNSFNLAIFCDQRFDFGADLGQRSAAASAAPTCRPPVGEASRFACETDAARVKRPTMNPTAKAAISVASERAGSNRCMSAAQTGAQTIGRKVKHDCGDISCRGDQRTIPIPS
jgi:hypothetical protein